MRAVGQIGRRVRSPVELHAPDEVVHQEGCPSERVGLCLAGPHTPVDVVADEPDVRFWVPVQAEGDIPLGSPAQVAVVEVHRALTGGDLEDTEAAAGDAL